MTRVAHVVSITLALAAGWAPAQAATVLDRAGRPVTGEIQGTVVQRLSVWHHVPAKGLVIQEDTYLLTSGRNVISLDGEGLAREGGAAGVVAVGEARKVRGRRLEWREPDDASVLTAAFRGRSDCDIRDFRMAGRAALVPTQHVPGRTVSTLKVVGTLSLSSAGVRFDPALTVRDADGEVRVPVGDLAPFRVAGVAARDGTLKTRASGSLQGSGWRLVAVEVENTQRASVPQRYRIAGSDPWISPDAAGAVWHFRCELVAPGGVGFNLPLLLASFAITDERGREFVPFDKLAHGFELTGGTGNPAPGEGGFVEFLALGPADSRVVTLRAGQESIEIALE